jgi:hypothetical protein
VFPNVHDERYKTMTRDPLVNVDPPSTGDAKCNTGNEVGQSTNYMQQNVNLNKCVRRLTRPVFIAGSRGQYSVRRCRLTPSNPR